jgi:2-amino-4-hydroxy-6-hydroxymethyldihydropteridine diphosphokinase
MDRLLEIEIRAGRQRQTAGYADRSLDIDILFYGGRILCLPEITIPHPRLQERRFALVPLCEIAPGFIHPVSGLSVSELLAKCSDPAMPVQISPSSAKL